MHTKSFHDYIKTRLSKKKIIAIRKQAQKEIRQLRLAQHQKPSVKQN